MKSISGRLLCCGLLLSFFVGCAQIPVTPSNDDYQIPIATSNSIPAVVTPSIQPTLVTTSQPLIFYFPEVEKRCPENREVSFDKLGVNKDSMVILADLAQTGLWKFSTENQEPTLFRAIPSNSVYGRSLNPTGNTLAFIVRNEDNSSSIWLLSLNSGDQREISRIDYLEGAFPNIHWVSNTELLVNGSCAGAGCPFPIKVLNTISGMEIDVEDTYSDPSDNFLKFFANDGQYTALYSSYKDDGYNQFYVYDYSAAQKISILPWLDDRIFFYPLIGTNFSLTGLDDSLIMRVEQSYGYDAGVVGARVDDMAQDVPYDFMMKRVFTQIAFGDIDYSSVVVNPVNKDLLMSMSYVDHVNTDLNEDFSTVPRYVENGLFAVDLNNSVEDDRIAYIPYIDYCFITTNLYSRGFSPDGRIMTFGSDDEIVFLNLETGYVSRLSGWSFVGWAK